MVWTLLLLLTVAWLLALVAGVGPPSRWALPAAIAALFLYRVTGMLRRE